MTAEPHHILSYRDLINAMSGFVKIGGPGEIPPVSAAGQVVRSHRLLAEQVSTLEAALRLAYPYVKDAWTSAESPSLAAIVEEDLHIIAPLIWRDRGLGADPATQETTDHA